MNDIVLSSYVSPSSSHFFFSNDSPTTGTSTLSLHDALPICHTPGIAQLAPTASTIPTPLSRSNTTNSPDSASTDRKSTRLNPSHVENSYAVFSFKKKTRLRA